MFMWFCDCCHGKFYSSDAKRKKKYVQCLYCGHWIRNPYYDDQKTFLNDNQPKLFEEDM